MVFVKPIFVFDSSSSYSAMHVLSSSCCLLIYYLLAPLSFGTVYKQQYCIHSHFNSAQLCQIFIACTGNSQRRLKNATLVEYLQIQKHNVTPAGSAQLPSRDLGVKGGGDMQPACFAYRSSPCTKICQKSVRSATQCTGTQCAFANISKFCFKTYFCFSIQSFLELNAENKST